MTSLQEIRNAQRADGTATILAIGTANPAHCVYQDSFPDYYFRVTKSEHMTELKAKFKRICSKTMIRKRHVHLTEEILKENPNICAYSEPSLDAREKIMTKEIPRLGQEAALEALAEWGRPKSEITHVIFCSETSVKMPAADYELVKLLDLSLSVNRIMLYYQGCHGGGTALRIAKDIAENNKDARILAVCAEVTAVTFRGPCESHIDSLVGQALFGDGACAMIIGSNPNTSIERPIFYLVSAAQRILPDSDGAIEGFLREIGLTFYLKKNVPALIADNIENCLEQAFESIGVNDWNSLFWAAHPGGSAILDYIESKLELNKEKLKASRNVLSEYGNMAGASVLFILDEMRKSSLQKGQCTTGEGLEWGVLFGFGPGLTVETIVLRSVPI